MRRRRTDRPEVRCSACCWRLTRTPCGLCATCRGEADEVPPGRPTVEAVAERVQAAERRMRAMGMNPNHTPCGQVDTALGRSGRRQRW